MSRATDLTDFGLDDPDELDLRDSLLETARDRCRRGVLAVAVEESWDVDGPAEILRTARDRAIGGPWESTVDAPFDDNATVDQAAGVAGAAKTFELYGGSMFHVEHEKSLLLRGLADPADCEHVNPDYVLGREDS